MFRRPLAPLVLAVLVASCASANSPPEGRALLEQVARTYRALPSYRLEGTLGVRVSGQGMNQNLDIGLFAAGADRGRFRVELVHPTMGTRVVSNGDSALTWTAQSNQYVVRAASTVRGEGDSMANAGPDGSPVARYFQITRGLQGARVLRAETVTVGSEPIEAWVVEANMDPGLPQPDSSAKAVATWWIDRKRSIVLRDSLLLRTEKGPAGSPLEMVQTVTFRVAKTGEALADSVFALRAPTGATRATDAPQAARPVPELTGKKATDFTLRDLEGRSRTLSSYKGKVVLLDFWATWCGPCRRSMPIIAKLERELKAKGLTVFAINIGETPAAVQPYLTKNKYLFSVLLDRDMNVARNYKADAIPTTVIVGKDGTIAAYFTGVHEESELRDALKKAGLN